MKTLLVILAAAILLLGLTGCVWATRAQLENKLPRIDAEHLKVEVSTLYGAAGTLEERGVKWNGDRKTVEASTLVITSPVGTYKRTITGAAIGKAPEKNEP